MNDNECICPDTERAIGSISVVPSRASQQTQLNSRAEAHTALTCTRRHHRRISLSSQYDSSSRLQSSCRRHQAKSREREGEEGTDIKLGWLGIVLVSREPSGLIAEFFDGRGKGKHTQKNEEKKSCRCRLSTSRSAESTTSATRREMCTQRRVDPQGS